MPARRPHKNRQDTKKTRQAPFHLHFSSQIVVSVLRLDFPHCRRVLTTATRLVRIGRPVHFRPSDMPGNAAQSKSKFAGKNVGAMPPYLPSRANLRSGAEGTSESSPSDSAQASSVGFLFQDTSLRPLYANQEALSALTYAPRGCKNNGPGRLLESRVQSLFEGSSGSRQL